VTLADIIPSLRGSLPRTLDKDLWPATVRHLPGGDVSVAGVSLVEIAARYDSPTVVLDCDELQARCGGLRRVFGDACVAVAGGSVFAEHTVDLLAASGLSLAVLGDAELAHALAAGFPAERIVVDCGGLHSGTLRRAVSAGSVDSS
jgi:diaminopimelate decarboxylase